jgi:hypothetical protein
VIFPQGPASRTFLSASSTSSTSWWFRGRARRDLPPGARLEDLPPGPASRMSPSASWASLSASWAPLSVLRSCRPRVPTGGRRRGRAPRRPGRAWWFRERRRRLPPGPASRMSLSASWAPLSLPRARRPMFWVRFSRKGPSWGLPGASRAALLDLPVCPRAFPGRPGPRCWTCRSAPGPSWGVQGRAAGPAGLPQGLPGASRAVLPGLSVCLGPSWRAARGPSVGPRGPRADISAMLPVLGLRLEVLGGSGGPCGGGPGRRLKLPP